MATTTTKTTKKAREKFAKAHAGEEELPKIDEIAFGDGGHDSNGEPVEPDDEAKEVPGEFRKKDIEDVSVTSDTTVKVEGYLDGGEGEGKDVSSVGIYDEVGDLVAIKTFSPKTMDDETRLDIEWNEHF